MNKVDRTILPDGMVDVLATIGQNVRRLRSEKGFTLQTLAKRTRLSPSMLSLVERGKAGSSIGTLVVLASALGAEMSDLLGDHPRDDELVSRSKSQRVVETADGVSRRIVRNDRKRGIEIAINEYRPATASSPVPVRHAGFEYGIVLQGRLEITVQGQKHVLSSGDSIAYPSTQPHRIANVGAKRARALWINLRSE
jgi:transcriptional regulator with XRE-family HTH domain